MTKSARSVAMVLCAVMVWIGQGGAETAQRGASETALAPAGTAQRAEAEKATTAGDDVLQRRVVHLRRGINVSDWLAQLGDPSGYTKEHFDTAITAHDLDLIQGMGFDHVRLSVDPRPMFHARQAEQITPQDLAYLDAAVKMILDRGLAVDINIFADAEFKAKLTSDDEFVEQFADFWRALARHYSNLDAERVFFEILNEPEGRDRYRWYGVEAKLAAAIREGAPLHTIIATGAHWSDDDDLVFLEPLRDPNVIYAFHFYESHVFTHQGATWSSNYWHNLKGVPYPSTPENVQAAAAELPDAVTGWRWCVMGWTAGMRDASMRRSGKCRRGPTSGCSGDLQRIWRYRKNAEPKDRVAWLTDVRTSLEKHGIGWAMWEYHGGFGVVTTENGQPLPDDATLRALGLPVRSYQSSGNRRSGPN